MDDKKLMNDNELIKAFECCDGTTCEGCPFQSKFGEDAPCKNLERLVLDLIKRKDTEIDILIRKKETLKDEVAELQLKNSELKIELKAIRGLAEAYKAEIERLQKYKHDYYVLQSITRKEFAEKLKNHFWSKADCDVLIRGVIDNLLTELTDGDEGR